jgi:hypothetical protein
MAEASAAVERRKASALRSARAASDDAANSFAPSGALPPLIFLEAKAFVPFVAKARMHGHRGNESACFLPQEEREQRASCEQIAPFFAVKINESGERETSCRKTVAG